MKKMYKTNLIGWLMIAACLMGITHGYALTPSLSYSQDTISRTIQSFSYGFNTDLDGWTLIDNDGDGHCWYHSSEGGNHNSGVDTISGHVRGESFCNVLNAALTPDDYLVSPQRYGIVNGSTISFWARAQDANYPLEHFGVAISTSPSGNFNATSFTTIQEWTLTAKRGRGTDVGRDGRQINDSGTWYQYTCNLSAYSGQKVWIAIRHFNCTDQFIIGIDNIMINNVDTWFFEQGFVTDPGVMTNGGDASWTKGSQTTWGPNANHNIGYMLADEFTINAQTNINEITVYAYQTGSSTTSTFTGLYAQIFNGSPMNGGTIVWGNNTNNIMTTTAFTNCYRGSDGETGATTRPIMSITASGLNIQLTAGTYYLVYSLTGSGSSGPYGAPQCEPGIGNTGNGLQYTNNSWTNLIDTGSNTTYGCSMKLNGTQTGATNYTITVSASPTNGGAPYIGNTSGTTQATYNQGQSCTVHANPANGYSFTNWTENGTVVSTYANYTFNVNSNRNLVAHFQAQSQNYTITVSASPTNGGNPYIGSTPGTTQATYASGQSCTVHANPNNGYTFVRWTENGTQVSTNANYTFTVTSNRNLVAHFTQQTYNITVSPSPTNGGTVTGGGAFHYGESCTVTATANNGYTFTNWTENGTVVSTYANYQFTVTSSRTLVAHFAVQAPQTYTITVSANPNNGGSPYIGNTPGTTQASYTNGQTCTVHANPTNGYTFVRWTENGAQVSTNANYTFTVTSNRNLVAQFTQQQYHITVSANPTNGGSVTGSGYYYYGTVCTLHAAPSNGYTFEKWTLNGTQVSTSPDYSFTVIGDAAYVAHFQQSANNYTINVFANPTAGGIVSGGGTYQQGQQCTVAATANDGYDFINWTEDGEVISENNNYTFSVSNNRILVANFQIQSFNITVTIDPIEGGTVIGEGTYNYGDRCTLIATPNNGYAFNCWMENGTIVSTNPVLSFIVTGNVPYVAHFVQSTNDFTITASANPVNGGTVTGGGNYSLGESCTLTALPNDGFTFVNWVKNGNVVSEEPLLTFTVTENATYIANFAQNTNGYTITASANPISGGTITGTGTYVLGLTCTLTATANEGYKFVNWTENGVIQWMADQYEFVVDHDRTLVANFEALPTYTISAMAGANGTITPQGDVIVVKGADQTFIMTPDLGGSILKVMVDGIDIGPVDSYTFTNVNRNHTIYVSFSGMSIEETQNLNVNIYPNPAKDIVFIEGEEIETVTLYDLVGNCLRIMDYNTCKEMNVSGLSKGIYVLMLTTNDGHIGYQKLVLN